MKRNAIITREEMLEQIENFRLMDDDFMSRVFDDNNECTELVLRIILEKDDLVVKKVRAQYEIKNLRGRSVRLDVFAIDSTGKRYNIEIQRRDVGADAKRARYNSSLIDANITKPGENFQRLADTYVIFITERDIFSRGLPKYTIDRMVLETGEPFCDGAHIIYVNGEYRGDTPIGYLMHDFCCTEPEKMKIPALAEQTRQFKGEKGGRNNMCRSMEEMVERVEKVTAERVRKETKESNSRQIARNLLTHSQMSYEEIANITNLPPDTVKRMARYARRAAPEKSV